MIARSSIVSASSFDVVVDGPLEPVGELVGAGRPDDVASSAARSQPRERRRASTARGYRAVRCREVNISGQHPEQHQVT